jgi:MYXO-CTERM domain-containing protein
MHRRPTALALALFALLAGAGDASAYCRSAVCKSGDQYTRGKVCTPAEDDDCGVVLQWRQPCIGFALQEDGSTQVQMDQVDAIARRAFATWTDAKCQNGSPSIEVDDLGTVPCDQVEYNQHAGNANVVVFRDKVWPHEDDGQGSTDTIALTTVTYDVDKGDIFDADIEVNGVQNKFTTSDTKVDVDLQSVLTHEAGHFLGLGHTMVDGSTMFPNYANGTTSLRDLGDDDLAAICAVYPPHRSAKGACDGLPRHGFSPDCRDQQTEGHCSASPGSAPPGVWAMLPAIALLVLARRRSRA